MPRIKNKKFETFYDGVMDVCSVRNRVLTETKLSDVRFGLRTVGVSRFYRAKVASDTIDKLVSVPINSIIKRSDVLIIEGEQFKIQQIQEKIDTLPPCLYLSLERIVTRYQDGREENGE